MWTSSSGGKFMSFSLHQVFRVRSKRRRGSSSDSNHTQDISTTHETPAVLDDQVSKSHTSDTQHWVEIQRSYDDDVKRRTHGKFNK